MALLIDVNLPEWMTDEDLRRDVLSILPGTDIRVYSDMGDPSDIEMLAVSQLRPELASQLPNLKLIQKLGAGVETMVGNPDLPAHVRITRLKPDAPAQEIAEFCLAYILREQRNMRFHDKRQAECAWDSIAPRITATKFDEKIENPGGTFYIDGASVLYLVGSTMDWVEDDFTAGFVFENPNAKGACGCGESFMV